MILHGKKDLVIPVSHGETLFQSCAARKIFVNPPHMEHNTNITLDHRLLIVPMLRFFALPDYSFDELLVPPWIFDKRYSSMYVRPDPQVCFDRPQIRGQGAKGVVLPQGDDADTPLDMSDPGESDATSTEELVAHMYSPKPAPTRLTHPTVRHSHTAKRTYTFDAMFQGAPELCYVNQVVKPHVSAPHKCLASSGQSALGQSAGRSSSETENETAPRIRPSRSGPHLPLVSGPSVSRGKRPSSAEPMRSCSLGPPISREPTAQELEDDVPVYEKPSTRDVDDDDAADFLEAL